MKKSCGYLDGETLGFLHQGLAPQSRSSLPDTAWKDRDYYLVGCLKAVCFLDSVPGTAEEWLLRGRLYRNPRMILQRMGEWPSLHAEVLGGVPVTPGRAVI